MNLHEYQAKQLLRDEKLPVSIGYPAKTPDEAVNAASQIGGNLWVVKAQIHAGGRGKAGGVKILSTKADIRNFAKRWLGKKMITYQTGKEGQTVSQILVEQCTDIDRELYLGAVIDRATQRIVVMSSTEGGVEIEKVAAETPEKILKATIDPMIGAQPYQARKIAFNLGLKGKQINEFTHIFLALVKMFEKYDLSLIEINPLVVTVDGHLHCLDAKINVDGNALYRHNEIKDMHDPTQEDPREYQASLWDLNYVALDGSIGCMVNGAGLAMGTMDIIKLHGGLPANFLDVGGGATKERVGEAFKIILSDENVSAVLVNIFGGIVRCDLIAEGIVSAVKEVGVSVPVIVRLQGNNSKLGASILAKSGLDIIPENELDRAAKLAVEAAGRRT